MNLDTTNIRLHQPRPKMLFEVVEGARTGETLEVALPEPGEAPALIGRSRECAIWIDARDISRRHTEIFSGPDRRPVVRDLGSVNGTLVNGQLISQTTPQALQPDDHIRVGLTELIYKGLGAATEPPAVHPPTAAAAAASFRPPAPGFNLEQTHSQTSGSMPTLRLASTAGPVPAPARAATLPGQYFIYLVMRDGQRYLFEGEEAIVGRGQANDIVIDSHSISRQHARLHKTPNGVYVQDLGSTNKTFVNGVQADGPVLLRDGDVLRFGEVEADYKLEMARVTGYQPLVPRAPRPEEQTLVGGLNLDMEDTQRDTVIPEQTMIGLDTEKTFIGGPGWKEFPAPEAQRKNQEQSETALNIDIKIIGRNLRQASDVIPAASDTAATKKGAGLLEVARLEDVYLTEGSGRAVDVLLDKVRLGLKPGELVALVGPSGSGKTELLQVMAGLRAADRGQVTVLGRTLPVMAHQGGPRPNLEADKELARWRLRSVGYLASDPEFNPRQTALDHVMWALEEGGFGRDPRERLEQAAERLRLVGLLTPEAQRLRPGEMNRTERKQLALARALALNPPLLLADEPTGRIHSAAADGVFQLLRRLVAQGRTVFMVTSDQLWARNADRQIEILDGMIVGGLT